MQGGLFQTPSCPSTTACSLLSATPFGCACSDTSISTVHTQTPFTTSSVCAWATPIVQRGWTPAICSLACRYSRLRMTGSFLAAHRLAGPPPLTSSADQTRFLKKRESSRICSSILLPVSWRYWMLAYATNFPPIYRLYII